MATTAASLGREIGGRQEAERRFYSRMAITMLALMFIGFSASFYLRGLVPFPRPNPTLNPLIYLHGTVFTLWMLLFVVQVKLIGAGRRTLHKQLGIAGMLLAVAMLPLMYFVAVGQVARANQPPFVTPLEWLAVPLLSIPTFALFIALAWGYRRQPQVHKRFMLLAALLLMEPAIGRLPLMPPSIVSQYGYAFLSWLLVVPLMLWDRRSLGSLHWATKLGAVLMALTLVFRFAVWRTDGWERFGGALVALTG